MLNLLAHRLLLPESPPIKTYKLAIPDAADSFPQPSGKENGRM